MRSHEIKSKLLHEKIHQYFIDRLLEMGVTHSQLGRPVQGLDYDEAKYEYTLAEIRSVDISNDQNKWF